MTSTRHAHLLLPAALASLLLLPAAASAQSHDERFVLRLSAFNPDASLRFSGDGVATAGEDSANFDFDERIETGDKWRPRGAIGFAISDRQAIVGNYYDYRRTNGASYGGGVFDPADFGVDEAPVEIPAAEIDGQLKFSLASLNYEYSVVRTERFQWGLGLGLTYAELEAGATARSTATEELDAEEAGYRWKRSGLSPGIHTRFAWTPADRWHIGLEAQYVDTRWGDFLDERGHFERGGLVVEYMVSDRIGVHAGYDWFRLKLGNEYRGSLEAPAESGVGDIRYDGTVRGELRAHGPLVGMTFKF